MSSAIYEARKQQKKIIVGGDFQTEILADSYRAELLNFWAIENELIATNQGHAQV